ncbi:MAG: hypothetical protein MK074_03710 [Phycisphaerales bacterium]|nr:hypothetical protein [Phycisphaerales bacterium]
MAIRTSAGTGVVISLVVFILLTVALAVVSILIWGQLREARQSVNNADRTLSEYATSSERTSPWMDQLQSTRGRSSVTGLLHGENGDLKRLVGGNPGETMDSLQGRLTEAGLAEDNTALDLINSLNRDLDEARNNNASLNQRVTGAEASVDDLKDRLAAVEAQQVAVSQAAAAEVEPFRDADSRHEARISDAIDQFQQAEARTADRYADQIDDLESENDDLRRRNTILSSRVADLEALYAKDRIEPTNPSMLADARVIEVVGTDRVYLDRGRQDHIVLGMTFEVFDDPAQIRPSDDGIMPRGKASLQVLKVGENTSTAKITRSNLRRPVLVDDVVANAVYDPAYTFRFMVHGKFDLNNDGASTEDEARYLRERIRRWGGEVHEGDTLPGDLDFLVLGDQPILPERPQGASLSPQEWQDYTRKRQIFEDYQTLFDAAREARIPILNQRRLDILTGRTDH